MFPSVPLRASAKALVFVLLCAFLVGPSFAQVRYTVTDLGHLSGISGRDWSYAYGINSFGTVVGSDAGTPFLYQNGVMRMVSPDVAKGQASGVSDNGNIAGARVSGLAWALLKGTLVSIPTLGGFRNEATSVNNRGQVVGWSLHVAGSSGIPHPFLYENGSVRDLGTLGGGTEQAYAVKINDKGQIAGYSSSPSGNRAVIWLDTGGITNLGTLPGYTASAAYDINNHGHVVGNSSTDTSIRPFLYRDGRMQELPILPGLTYATADGINDRGEVVGHGDSTAWLYRNGDVYDLNALIPADSGWKLTAAYKINNAGQIVGYGRYQEQDRAFLLTPVRRYILTDLGTLGGTRSIPHGINNNGQVTGESEIAGSIARHAFLWSAGKMQDVGMLPGGLQSYGYGINDSGQVLVQTLLSNEGMTRTAIYDSRTGTTSDIGTLPGNDSTTGHAINASGHVVGTFRNLGPGGQNPYARSFLYDGTLREIHPPANRTGIAAYGINDSGQVVGETAIVDGLGEAVLYNEGSPTLLPRLSPGHRAFAVAISNTGVVVGAAASSQYRTYHPVLWYGGVVHDLGAIGPFTGEGYAYGVNSSGEVVGTSGANGRAFLWSGGQMLNLNDAIPADSGWVLSSANAINDRGQIAGYGVNPSGQVHAFLLNPEGSEIPLPDPDAVVLNSDHDGDGTPDGAVAGIVCDNLRGMSAALLNRLVITLPEGFSDALVTADPLDPKNGRFAFGPNVGKITYFPPDEFNENPEPTSVPGDLTKSATRPVSITLRLTKPDGSRYVVTKEIVLARPPVVLVHGINNTASTWNDLQNGVVNTLGVRVPFTATDHSWSFNGNGPVEVGANRLAQTIARTIAYVRQAEPIPFTASDAVNVFSDFVHADLREPTRKTPLAIRRVDVVAWSYGGVVTRWYLASRGSRESEGWYRRNPSYGVAFPDPPDYSKRNDVRKVITLGSMWRGVPLSNVANEVTFHPDFPSPSGFDLGSQLLEGGTNSIRSLIDVLQSSTPVKPYWPVMEVIAVYSPWLCQLIYHDPFRENRPLYARPFEDNVAYGSIAGDDNNYPIDLRELGITVTVQPDPYRGFDNLTGSAGVLSPFPYLRWETHDLLSNQRNYSDGLVPLWSASIPDPDNARIVGADHNSYARDPETRAHLVQMLSSASLKQGATLNGRWTDEEHSSVTSRTDSNGNARTWRFRPDGMAPYAASSQDDVYDQIAGVGRIKPAAIKEIQTASVNSSTVSTTSFTATWTTATGVDLNRLEVFEEVGTSGISVWKGIRPSARETAHRWVVSGPDHSGKTLNLRPNTRYYCVVSSERDETPDRSILVISNPIRFSTPNDLPNISVKVVSKNLAAGTFEIEWKNANPNGPAKNLRVTKLVLSPGTVLSYSTSPVTISSVAATPQRMTVTYTGLFLKPPTYATIYFQYEDVRGTSPTNPPSRVLDLR